MITDEDRWAREDDREERADERRRDSLWLAAQARTADAVLTGHDDAMTRILTASGLPNVPPPNRSAFIADAVPDTAREFAAHCLHLARVARVGVEAMGARESAWMTLHEATRMASYRFACAHRDGSVSQSTFLGAFIELHERTERARAALAAKESGVAA